MSEHQSRSPAITPIGLEILLSLAQGPLHGYGIKLDIEARTAGAISLGSGTLYQAIQRLEREGLIAGSETREPQTDPRRGRIHRLEPAGRSALEAELRRLHRLVEYARTHDLLSEPERP